MIDKNIEFEQFVNEILDISGEIALNNFRKIRDLTLKGDFSPVTKADEDIEKFIRSKIFEKYPSHKIVGEELDDLSVQKMLLGTLIQLMVQEVLLLESMTLELL